MQSLLLGTAHWGMDYGITNRDGRLSDTAIADTVAVARAAGITTLDTAPGYGDAEARIRVLAPDFRIQTKINAVDVDLEHLRQRLATSLERLGRPRIWSLVVHDWPALAPGRRGQVAAQLEEFRARGLTERVGVSGYRADDLRTALDAFEHPDVAQMPVSILDQRLDGAPEVAELRSRGGVLQARSILLQGVASGAPSQFSAHPDVQALGRSGTPIDLALGYVRSQDWIDEVILGVTSAQELTQLTTGLTAPAPAVDWHALASRDEDLIDPRRWEART